MTILGGSCCCTVHQAATLCGNYAILAYGAALGVSIYWIVETEGQIPATGYALTCIYFVTFLLSVFLVLSISLQKKSTALLMWFLSIGFLVIPECGLTMYTCIWLLGIKSEKGIGFLTFYLARAIVNFIALASVHSLYRKWFKEKECLRRRISRMYSTSLFMPPADAPFSFYAMPTTQAHIAAGHFPTLAYFSRSFEQKDIHIISPAFHRMANIAAADPQTTDVWLGSGFNYSSTGQPQPRVPVLPPAMEKCHNNPVAQGEIVQIVLDRPQPLPSLPADQNLANNELSVESSETLRLSFCATDFTDANGDYQRIAQHGHGSAVRQQCALTATAMASRRRMDFQSRNDSNSGILMLCQPVRFPITAMSYPRSRQMSEPYHNIPLPSSNLRNLAHLRKKSVNLTRAQLTPMPWLCNRRVSSSATITTQRSHLPRVAWNNLGNTRRFSQPYAHRLQHMRSATPPRTQQLAMLPSRMNCTRKTVPTNELKLFGKSAQSKQQMASGFHNFLLQSHRSPMLCNYKPKVLLNQGSVLNQDLLPFLLRNKKSAFSTFSPTTHPSTHTIELGLPFSTASRRQTTKAYPKRTAAGDRLEEHVDGSMIRTMM